jgi:uncharacterized FlaG/YvyC family protein
MAQKILSEARQIKSVSIGDTLLNHARMPYTVIDVRGSGGFKLVNVIGNRSNSREMCFDLNKLRETFTMEKKAMSKKTKKKRSRRSSAEVLKIVKNIKESIAHGMRVGEACKKHGMTYPQYQSQKNKVWPEGKSYSGEIEVKLLDIKTGKRNEVIREIQSKIIGLKGEIEKLNNTIDVLNSL